MAKLRSKSRKTPFSRTSTIVLDVGDTLFPTTALMKSSLSRAAEKLEKLGFITNAAAFCKIYLDVDSQLSGPSINHLFSGLDIIERVWPALNLPLSPPSTGTFLGLYREFVRRGIKEDSRLSDMLSALRHSGYRLAVLSDGSTEEQMEQLFRLGIVRLLDAVVTSQEVGTEKPSRQMFEFLFSSLSIEPAEAVMVGNDPIRDIAGAAAVGMRSILVVRYSHSGTKNSGADLVIPDILALRQVFLKHVRT